MDNNVIIAINAVAAVLISWPLVRKYRIKLLSELAESRMLAGSEDATTLGGITGDQISSAELGAYGAVTAAEFAWTWAAIDPSVIHAADFSSSTSIHNGFQFAQYLHDHYDSLAPAAKDGFINRLAGYVGEHNAADILVHSGHIVQMASSATQPVWDMLVDGHSVNVKTVSDIASIKAEAAAHPGTQYLVPEDAHGHLASNMHHLAGLNHDAIKESVHQSLLEAHGDTAAHGLLHHLPLVTLGFAVYRNVEAVHKGVDPLVAIHHGIAETVGRGTGVALGAQCGTFVGSLCGPIGALIGGLLGGLGGALLGSAAANSYKRIPLNKALAELEQALDAYGKSFDYKIDEIKQYVMAPVVSMKSSLRQLQQIVENRKQTLRWLLWPDFYTVLLDQAMAVGNAKLATKESESSEVTGILDSAARSGRYAKVGLLMVNSPAVRELVGGDDRLLTPIESAQQNVLYERKQLNPDFVAPT
jgi:hypothetical protein